MKDFIYIVKDTWELVKQSKTIQPVTKVVQYESNRDWFDFVEVFGGIASSVIIFVLGIVFSNIISKRKVKRKNKEYYDFFIEYLKQQKESIDRQIKELKKIKSRMDEIKYHRAPKLIMHLQQFYILDSFNKEQLLSAYKEVKKKPSDLMNILHELEYARVLFKDIETSLQTYSNRQNELTDLLNVDLKQWDTLTRKDNGFLVEVIKQIDTEKLKKLAEFERSLNLNKNTLSEMMIQYYIPTLNLLTEIDNKNPDSRLQQFIMIGRNMEHTITNKDLIFNHFKDKIDHALEGLKALAIIYNMIIKICLNYKKEFRKYNH